ncbi:MAG: tRNA 2-thiocytidine(32) synthetase TtcA, partial [Pseudomonadota bacterium]
LGHHSDDILETFFLNLFHGGRLATMPPKLVNEDGDLTVLRPLALCAETDLTKFSDLMEFPIIPCDLCGSQDGLQRQVIKSMLAGWEQSNPGRKRVMLKALANARPSHLLDRSLFDFAGLAMAGANKEEADEPCEAASALSDLRW